MRRLRKCEGWLIRFGTVLVWIDPNYFGSLYSNPNKSYGWRCSTILPYWEKRNNGDATDQQSEYRAIWVSED